MAEGMKGKVAIVTGASSGIGAGIAEHFTRLGCHVVITARRKEQLEDVKKRCGGAEVVVVSGDVTDPSLHQRLISTSMEKFGKLDFLVNNAGAFQASSARTVTEENYDFIMNTNLKSAVLLTRAAIPQLVKTKGCILNISSVASTCPEPQAVMYCVSKAGLNMFTQCLASDLAKDGVRINAICPGAVETPMLDKAVPMPDKDDVMKAVCPIGRIGSVEDIAQMAVFLCSPLTGSYITGTCIPVDGGYTSIPRVPGDITLVGDK